MNNLGPVDRLESVNRSTNPGPHVPTMPDPADVAPASRSVLNVAHIAEQPGQVSHVA